MLLRMSVAQITLLTGIVMAWAGEQPTDPDQHQQSPNIQSPRVAQYAPGVRIDWQAMQIELAGEVVMREGLIELFACSRGTREHESIIRIDARPLHVYEALGLIGLEPGRPGYYDDASQKWIIPTGDRLQAFIRIEPDDKAGKRAKTFPLVSVWQWMRETESKQTPQPRDWVFCGSRRTEDGRFLADSEGTVLCVVDFSEALIALAEAHTADNAEVWLEADPRRVPPKGTRCTILLRAVSPVDKSPVDNPSTAMPPSENKSAKDRTPSSVGASEPADARGG